jgi:hypothetical protein
MFSQVMLFGKYEVAMLTLKGDANDVRMNSVHMRLPETFHF